MAGLRGAGEFLVLGVGLAGGRRIPLALGHEALERSAGKLLVRGLRLAGRERGAGHDAEGQYQSQPFHGLLPWWILQHSSLQSDETLVSRFRRLSAHVFGEPLHPLRRAVSTT